jgi:putative membrane protein
MRRRITTALLLLCCPLLLIAAESEQRKTAEDMFVTGMLQNSLAAVEMGKLAQTRSADTAVKTFAAKAVATYGKIAEELRAVARSKDISAPTELDEEHARLVHSVSAKPPSEFAAAFSKNMSTTQEQGLTLLSDASALRDQDLKSFAKRTLPLWQRQRAALSSLPSPPAQSSDATRRVSVDPDAPDAQRAQAAAADPTSADQAAPGVVDADAAARRAAEEAAASSSSAETAPKASKPPRQ